MAKLNEDIRTQGNTSFLPSPLLGSGHETTPTSSGLSNYVQHILHSQKTQNVSIQELLKKVH